MLWHVRSDAHNDIYLAGIIREDGGTEGDKGISSRLWMFLAKLVIESVSDMRYTRVKKEVLTFMIAQLSTTLLLMAVSVSSMESPCLTLVSRFVIWSSVEERRGGG